MIDSCADHALSQARTRSLKYRQAPGGRYWWYGLDATGYVPAIYSNLSDDEWAVMEAWFAETDELQVFGESNVPLLSFVQGLVMGNGIRRIVQLGHYYGYSTLLIGFMLRRMNAKPGIISIDISDEVTSFTKKWIGRAGLDQYARLIVGDSASEESYQAATAYLGGQPELIIIDSSHQYAHTIDELNLWTVGLPKGAIVLLHDTSGQATEYDPTREGGVRRALAEWTPEHPEFGHISLNGFVETGTDGNQLVYKDGCGLGILQRQNP